MISVKQLKDADGNTDLICQMARNWFWNVIINKCSVHLLSAGGGE